MKSSRILFASFCSSLDQPSASNALEAQGDGFVECASMGDFGGRLPGPAHVPEGTAADQVLLPIGSFCSAGRIGNQSTKRFLCQLTSINVDS